ncbi:MAG: InlB B-repeat-containing protein, partial [Clostridia bacterium]|nr:InlB B-repeat-containing protein [Clostridia bacterium]
NVSGNVLACGIIKDSDKLLNCATGEIKNVTEDEFNAYLTSSKVTFDANGGSAIEESKTVYYGQVYGELPVPTREHYSFAGWYTDAENGTEVTADSIVEALVNQTLYAHWDMVPYTVTWYDENDDGYSIVVKRTSSPNAGVATGILANGENIYYGDVLEVTYTKDDYYTLQTNGVTFVTVTGDVTSSNIYATATLNPISDWVQASEVPSGAQIVNTKWKYTLKEYESSSLPSLPGYIRDDCAITGYSEWKGPVYSDPSNGEREVSAPESYVVSSNYKKVYHYYRYKSSDGSISNHTKNTTCPYFEDVYVDSLLTETSWGGGYCWYYNGTNYHTVWKCAEFEVNQWVSDNYGTRWYYKDPIYTYYYHRDLSKESTSDPTGQSNVSNVVKWVQYRAK